jgi:hypothetical protein
MIGGFQADAFQPAFQQASQPTQTAVIVQPGVGGDWRDFVTERSQRHLKLEIRTKERQLKKVAKKLTNAERQLVFKPEGILANLHRLETKRTVLIAEIQQLKIKLDFPDFDDEDDIEALLLDS